MDILANVAQGFSVALQPVNLLACFIGVFIGTLVGVLPGIGPVSAMSLLLPVTLAGSPESRDHHDGRHLLRLDVWRLDDLDPRQHPGRGGLGRDLPRRPPDGAAGPGRAGARHRGARLVLRRHLRDRGADARRAGARERRHRFRPGRVFQPDGARPHRPHLPDQGSMAKALLMACVGAVLGLIGLDSSRRSRA